MRQVRRAVVLVVGCRPEKLGGKIESIQVPLYRPILEGVRHRLTWASLSLHPVHKVGRLVHVDPQRVVGDGVVELTHQDAPPLLLGRQEVDLV